MISRRAIGLSVGLHLVVLILLVVGVDFSSHEAVMPTETSHVVHATVVDQAAVRKEVERLKAADDQARRDQVRKVQEAQRKARDVEARRKAEEARVKELKAEQERLKQQEQSARQQVADAKRKAQQEQARIAKLREAEAQRKAEDQRKAEERRKAEAQRKAEEAEKKKKEEAERKRQEEARKKAEAERRQKALQAELDAEQKAREQAQQEKADADELNRYMVKIRNQVISSYTFPPGMEGLSCTLRITLVPGGEVTNVQVVKSSGNPAFDLQAENAVRRAAPLPVPANPRLFQKMRSISFVFDPQS